MYTSNNTFSVTDLRKKTVKVLKEAKNSGFVHLVNRSKTEAALVDIDYLRALQEAYEDMMDIKEYEETIRMKRIPFDKYLEKRSKKASKK
ncbi:MAG: hypothetical protein AAB801_01355 [Patescibacteria group bacterium]